MSRIFQVFTPRDSALDGGDVLGICCDEILWACHSKSSVSHCCSTERTLVSHPFGRRGRRTKTKRMTKMTQVSTGVLYVHSSPRALSPHVEWAISRVLGRGITLDWTPQPILEGTQRAEYYWQGPAGSGAAIASALLGWAHLRFEVTEDPFIGTDGGRWCHTPSLGIFHSPIDAAGNMIMTENRLRAVLDFAGTDGDLLREGINRSLGSEWDAELDVFRYASDHAPVRWLHQVG